MLIVIKRIILFVGAQALIFTFASGENRTFTGEAVNGQDFSTALNWKDDTLPDSSDNVYVGADGGVIISTGETIICTSQSSPAIINNTEVVTFSVYSNADGGVGTSYAVLPDSVTLKALTINVGNPNNQWYDGDFVVREGGTVNRTDSPYLNSGSFNIGGNSSSSGDGSVRVEAGATFGHTRLNLMATGSLIFELDQDGAVSTFTSTAPSSSNVLDGLLQVDFDELNVPSGTYTLINGESESTTTLVGKLIDDLNSAIDKKLTTNTTHFEVLNNTYDGGLDWYLTTADDGKDLQFVVGIIPEPNALSLVVVVAVGVMSMRRPRMSFTDKS